MPSSQPGAPTSKSLGLAACTAIVIGNMVGSGFYLSPAATARYGTLAILAWVVMGAGAICVGLTFAKLARLDHVKRGTVKRAGVHPFAAQVTDHPGLAREVLDVDDQRIAIPSTD